MDTSAEHEAFETNPDEEGMSKTYSPDGLDEIPFMNGNSLHLGADQETNQFAVPLVEADPLDESVSELPPITDMSGHMEEAPPPMEEVSHGWTENQDQYREEAGMGRIRESYCSTPGEEVYDDQDSAIDTEPRNTIIEMTQESESIGERPLSQELPPAPLEEADPQLYEEQHVSIPPVTITEAQEQSLAEEESCEATAEGEIFNTPPVPVETGVGQVHNEVATYAATMEVHSLGGISVEHDEVPAEDEESLAHEVQPSVVTEGIPKERFQQIRQNLENKSVTGSLQPQPPAQTNPLYHAAVSPAQKKATVFYDNSSTSRTMNYSEHEGGLATSTPLVQHQTAHSGGSPEHPELSGGEQGDHISNSHSQRPELRRAPPSGMAQVCQAMLMSDLQTTNVTVYLDRAEVCRNLTPTFKVGEITEILLEQLSPAIDKDSIRVEVRGAATILDVAYSARPLADVEDTWSRTTSQIQTELRQYKRQEDSLTSRIQRAEKQRSVLNNFADNLTRKDDDKAAGLNYLPPTGPAPPGNHGSWLPSGPGPMSTDKRSLTELPGSNTMNPYDPNHMETLQRFLNLYEEQIDRLDSTMSDGAVELERIKLSIEHLESELVELERKQEDRLARHLSILVEPRENGPVDMFISYVVGRCSWKPAYDIRIFNSDGSMKIIYYGMVQQLTGEDWETKRMTLSTAQPAVGGLVPALSTQKLHYKQSPQSLPKCGAHRQSNMQGQGRNTRVGRIHTFRKSTTPSTMSIAENGRHDEEAPRIMGTPVGTLQRATSNAEGYGGTLRAGSVGRTSTNRHTIGSSILLSSGLEGDLRFSGEAIAPTGPLQPPVATVTFEVPRPPALIPSTNEECRATVGLLDLQPTYDYVTVPKRALSVYLKAHAANTSNFFILPGQTNIYSDNTFIGKSELNAVAPGEQFSCDLGAETGIEVMYRPMYKCKEGSGSSQKAAITFKQCIELKNTFQRQIRVMVVDQLPVSGEDKIKVSLLEPTIKHPEKYDKNKPIRLNKSNNIEWDIDLRGGESKEIVLKFAVEYPANEEIEVCPVEH